MDGIPRPYYSLSFSSMIDEHHVKFLDKPWVIIAAKSAVLFFIPWCIWVTVTLMQITSFMEHGERFTDKQAFALKSNIKEELYESERRTDQRIDQLPPQLWQDQVRQVQTDLRRLEQLIHEFERTFTKEFIRKTEHNPTSLGKH